jgi:hypothetical protein
VLVTEEECAREMLTILAREGEAGVEPSLNPA